MSALLAHCGLPTGVRPWHLVDLVKQVGRASHVADRISRTAVAVIEYCIAACREGDFQAGKICGIWEQPSTIAANLGISTKVLHNAEAELRAKGWIARTSNAHARRRGERRGHNIVSLEGISLAPLINRYDELVQIRDAQTLQQQALSDLRAEIAQVRRQIRELSDVDTIEQAEAILPRGRTSRISRIDLLEPIKADLEALLVLVNLPSGDTKTSHRTEEAVAPNIPKENLNQNRSGVQKPAPQQETRVSITPERVAGLASEDYQATLAAQGGPSWPNLVETSSLACNWLGIAQHVWGEACHSMGRERAALCIIVIDRNRRLPEGHVYHRKHASGTLRGMIRKGGDNLNLLGLLGAIKGYPGGECGNAVPIPQAQCKRLPSGPNSVRNAVSNLMARLSKAVSEDEPC